MQYIAPPLLVRVIMRGWYAVRSNVQYVGILDRQRHIPAEDLLARGPRVARGGRDRADGPNAFPIRRPAQLKATLRCLGCRGT